MTDLYQSYVTLVHYTWFKYQAHVDLKSISYQILDVNRHPHFCALYHFKHITYFIWLNINDKRYVYLQILDKSSMNIWP